MRCEGINVLLCDGEVAFQTVFHFHLHVIPRYAGDGWTLKADSPERERPLLDSDAQAIKAAIASSSRWRSPSKTSSPSVGIEPDRTTPRCDRPARACTSIGPVDA